MAQNEVIQTVEDVNLVAFLTMRGVTLIPYIKSHKEGTQRRVAWDICNLGYDADRVIKEFYANSLVGVRDFVRALKEVRADMYQIKNINNEEKEEGD